MSSSSPRVGRARRLGRAASTLVAFVPATANHPRARARGSMILIQTESFRAPSSPLAEEILASRLSSVSLGAFGGNSFRARSLTGIERGRASVTKRNKFQTASPGDDVSTVCDWRKGIKLALARHDAASFSEEATAGTGASADADRARTCLPSGRRDRAVRASAHVSRVVRRPARPVGGTARERPAGTRGAVLNSRAGTVPNACCVARA